MNVNTQTFKNAFKKYRKRLIYLAITVGVGYFLYRKFLHEKVKFLKEVYDKFSSFNEIISFNSNYENINQQFESSFNNLISSLIEEIKQRIEDEFSLNMLVNQMQTGNQTETIKLWIVLKNRTLIALICSIFVTRTLILLSQTHLLLLEKEYNKNKQIQKSFYEDLLTELWLLAKNFILHMIKQIENKLSPYVENFNIKQLYTEDQIKKEIEILREKVETIIFQEDSIKFLIFNEYIKEIEKKIALYENNNYVNDFKSQQIECFLRFYKTYYDIITSNLFQIVLMKALNSDYSLINEIISLNFEESRKLNVNTEALNGAKIINFLNKIRRQNLEFDHTIFLKKEFYKNAKVLDDFNEYFKIIYE